MSATIRVRTVGFPNEGFVRVAEALDERNLHFGIELVQTCYQPQVVIYHDKSEIVEFYTGTEYILACLDNIERIIRHNPI